jgi:hypothetical protein
MKKLAFLLVILTSIGAALPAAAAPTATTSVADGDTLGGGGKGG